MSVTYKKKNPNVFLSIGCGRRYHVCQRRSHRAKEALISKSPRVERTGMPPVEADLVMTSQPGARTGPSLRVLRGWSGVSVCGGAVMRRSLTALTAQLTCKQWAAVNHGNITSLPTCSPQHRLKKMQRSGMSRIDGHRVCNYVLFGFLTSARQAEIDPGGEGGGVGGGWGRGVKGWR